MTKKAKRGGFFRSGRSALWVIALLLFGSAAIRLGIGAGEAIALETSDMGADMGKDAGKEMPAEMQSCETPEGLEQILTSLSDREELLDAREAMLLDRIAALNIAETEIAKNLKALEDAEAELAATLAVANTAAEDDLTRLTAVYESMKPKEAASLFEEMSPDFAAGFLGRMRPDAAAAIMAGLKAPTAYSISVILAGRNANVPTE